MRNFNIMELFIRIIYLTCIIIIQVIDDLGAGGAIDSPRAILNFTYKHNIIRDLEVF